MAIVEGAGDAAALEAAMANWLCVVKSNDFTAAKDVFLAACKGKKASNVWGAQCAEQLGLILRALRKGRENGRFHTRYNHTQIDFVKHMTPHMTPSLLVMN